MLCSLPEEFSEPGIEPALLVSPALTRRYFTTSATWEASVLTLDLSQKAEK